MINTEEKDILDSSVAKAIAVGLHNPFDKKVCSNCRLCTSKGEIHYYCGQARKPVTASSACSKFTSKNNSEVHD